MEIAQLVSRLLQRLTVCKEKKNSPDTKLGFPLLQLVLVASSPITEYHWEDFCSVVFIPSH